MAATKKQRTVAQKPTIDLFSWNKWLAIFYALQGVALIIVGVSKSFPVFTTFLTQNSLDKNGPLVQATQRIFDVNVLTWLVVGLFIAAVIHALLASAYRSRYEVDLSTHQNRMRWLSFGVMTIVLVIAVALLSGISDIVALVAVGGLLIAKSTAAYLTEVTRKTSTTALYSYVIACGAGGLVLALIGWTMLSALVIGTSHVPVFVYWLYVTLLAGMIAHAILTYRVMKQKGKWADAYVSERAYLVLGLVTQTLLVWQIFAGALHP